LPLVSVAIIVVTFAALEWREAHLPEHARARRGRRKWPAAGPAHSCNTIRARSGVIVVAGLFVTALAALSGCATLRGQDAVSTEQLLATAGFQKRNADSPEQARSLASMPPFRLVARGVGLDVAYTYADPVSCHCLYIGGPQQYVEYQRLATEREIAEGELWAENDEMDWGLWGGWLR
jgi:hypothetical protein